MDDDTYSSESGSEEDIMDVHSLCRLCAIRATCLIPLFGDEGRQYDLEGKIKSYLPIECAAILLSWHSMYTKCMGAQKKLKSLAVIAMAYRMSTKENQHDGMFSTEEHNLNIKLECDSLSDEGSNISDDPLQDPEDSVKPGTSRFQTPDITKMISPSSLPAVNNLDCLKLNEDQGSCSRRTAYVRPRPDTPVSKYNLCQAQDFKEEPIDYPSDAEIDKSDPLAEDSMCDSKKVHKNPELVCAHCNEKFLSWRNLDLHFRTFHSSSQIDCRQWYSEDVPEDSYVQVFHCMVCDRSFLHTAQHFMKHMKSHERSAIVLLDHDYCKQ